MVLPWRTGDLVADRYEVIRVHEHGGMALVYRVRHLSWDTDLAVKRPRPEWLQSAAHRERFVAEAETWVSLGTHPNVCACHYVRTLDGVPCVFAEYVAGGSLREWIDDRRLYEGAANGTARVLDLAIQVAWGLRHAHDRGLVHQDVKPANVLLDHDGTAKVTDFGLARTRAIATDPMDRPARPGVSVPVPNGGMTGQYASPEQMAGSPLGRRTDIYSFAVSVLEMFTGGPTWMAGPAAGEALAAHRAEGPGAPGLPAMPSTLAGLLARCLLDEPARRPGSMTEIVRELTGIYRQVAGRAYPRPAPAAAELRAGELNNRALSLLDLDRAAEAAEAFEQARQADPRHLEATYNAGLLRWRSGGITDEDLLAAVETVRTDTVRTDTVRTDTGDPWEARYLLAQVHTEREDLPAARALLVGMERERPGEPRVEAALRTIESGRAAGGRCAGTLEMPWHADPSRPLMQAVALTPDGRLAVIGSSDGTLRSWNPATGDLRSSIDAHRGRVESVDVDDGGNFAVSLGLDGVMRYWDLDGGRCLRVIGHGHSHWVKSVCLSADGRSVLSSGYGDGPIRLWDAMTGDRVRVFGQPGDATAVRFSTDGRFAVSCGEDSTVRLWDVETGRCVRSLDGHRDRVCDVAMTPDGRFALSGSADGTVRLWELDWDLAAREAADWDDGAAPYLEMFLARHGSARTAGDVDDLLRLLQDAGYGRLRPEAVLARLDRTRRPCTEAPR